MNSKLDILQNHFIIKLRRFRKKTFVGDYPYPSTSPLLPAREKPFHIPELKNIAAVCYSIARTSYLLGHQYILQKNCKPTEVLFKRTSLPNTLQGSKHTALHVTTITMEAHKKSAFERGLYAWHSVLSIVFGVILISDCTYLLVASKHYTFLPINVTTYWN